MCSWLGSRVYRHHAQPGVTSHMSGKGKVLVFFRVRSFNMHAPSGTNFCTGDFAPPKPEFGPEFSETNFGRPNFGPEFLGRIFWSYFFQQKRPPEKFTVEKFTSQNSPFKIQPRNRAKKFTLHLCRAILLMLPTFCPPTIWAILWSSVGNPPFRRPTIS